MKYAPQLIINRPLLPSKSVLDDENETSYYYESLMKTWTGSNRKMMTLGSNPVSLSKRMLESVSEQDHVVTLKSDGVKYVLFLCTRKDNSPIALMIDRSKHMYEVEVIAQKEHFVNKTILEGELVWNQPDESKLLFLAFDVICLKGELMTNRPFSQRIEQLEKHTKHSEEISNIVDMEEVQLRVSETDAIVFIKYSPCILLKPKRFVGVAHADAIWERRMDVQHRVDGLVIHRSDAPYRNGSAYNTTYKWKPEHSVDLCGDEEGGLFHSQGRVDEDTFDRRKVVLEPSKVKPSSKDEVVEYHLDTTSCPDEVRLFAMRTRPDKTYPNSLEVVKATFQDSLDDITPQRIADCAS